MNTTIETRVCGIPCQVEVLAYRPDEPDGRWEPGAPGEIDWRLLDRRGRHATWLERKLTQRDRDDVDQTVITHMDEHANDGQADYDDCYGL